MNFKIEKIQFKGDPLDDAWKKKSFQTQMGFIVHERFNEAKEDLIKDFEAHPISQEIKDPSKGNISGTLSSYFDFEGNKADLFGFVGFYAQSNPIEDVASFLMQNIKIQNLRYIRRYGKRPPRINVAFRVPTIYSFSKIASKHTDAMVTTNWVKGMETGIKGLQYYKVMSGKGRSRRAVQFENKLRSGRFKPKSYMSGLLRDFKIKLKGNTIL